MAKVVELLQVSMHTIYYLIVRVICRYRHVGLFLFAAVLIYGE